MNNVQPLGGWMEDIADFFTGGSSTPSSLPATDVDSAFFGGSSWGEILGEAEKFQGYNVTAINNYTNSGGVLATGNTGTSTTSDFLTDFTTGLGDFFKGVTTLIPAGLSAYAQVQQLINSQNPTDRIVNTPLGVRVERTQGGSVTYLDPLTLYPQYAQQIQQAQTSSKNTTTLLIAGVLGLGLILILKKK